MIDTSIDLYFKAYCFFDSDFDLTAHAFENPLADARAMDSQTLLEEAIQVCKRRKDRFTVSEYLENITTLRDIEYTRQMQHIRLLEFFASYGKIESKVVIKAMQKLELNELKLDRGTMILLKQTKSREFFEVCAQLKDMQTAADLEKELGMVKEMETLLKMRNRGFWETIEHNNDYVGSGKTPLEPPKRVRPMKRISFLGIDFDFFLTSPDFYFFIKKYSVPLPAEIAEAQVREHYFLVHRPHQSFNGRNGELCASLPFPVIWMGELEKAPAQLELDPIREYNELMALRVVELIERFDISYCDNVKSSYSGPSCSSYSGPSSSSSSESSCSLPSESSSSSSSESSSSSPSGPSSSYTTTASISCKDYPSGSLVDLKDVNSIFNLRTFDELNQEHFIIGSLEYEIECQVMPRLASLESAFSSETEAFKEIISNYADSRGISGQIYDRQIANLALDLYRRVSSCTQNISNYGPEFSLSKVQYTHIRNLFILFSEHFEAFKAIESNEVTDTLFMAKKNCYFESAAFLKVLRLLVDVFAKELKIV